MNRFRSRPLVSVFVLAAIAPVFLDGCVTVGVSRTKNAAAEAATGSLEVVIVEKSGDKVPTTSKIVTRLVRLESGVEIPVSESTDATWTKTDLPPGRYRLRVSHWIDEKGQPRKFAKTDQESFKLRAGELVQARVVLKGFPTGPVITVAAVVGVGILTAILVSAFSDWGSWNLGTTRRSEELDRDRTEKEHRRDSAPAVGPLQ
jgi:hypothetical protein